MRSRVVLGIRELFLSASDTVALQTPAASAMSAKVGLFLELFWSDFLLIGVIGRQY